METNKMRTLEQAFLTSQEKYSSRDLQIHSPQGRKTQKKKDVTFIYGAHKSQVKMNK